MKKTLLGLFTLLGTLCLAGGLTLAACGGPGEDSDSSGNSSSSSASDSDSSSSSAEDPADESLSTVIQGDLRIQLLSPTLLRIEEKGAKGFEDRASYIVSNREDWDKVAYTLENVSGGKNIVTETYTVHIPDGAKAADVYVTDASGNALWEFAGMTDTNVYIPSPSDELASWYFTDSPRIIPSDYGYSVSEDGKPLQGWDFKNDATDVFVFLPQGDYKQFCSDYTALTGSSEMVSLQTLGYWDSRWYAYSSESALQQIKDYTDRGYSIDVLVIDTDWRKNGSIGYDINTDLFPDMAAFLEECHQLGVQVAFNDHPEPNSGSNGLDRGEVEYRNKNLTLLLSMGLDYWWYDRNWSVALNSCDPDISVYAFGMYAYQWITQDYLESITDLDGYAKRALIMGNVDGCLHGKWNYASDLSAHRYSIQWTGDIGADTNALAQEIYASVFGGAEVGLPYMSSDIGGHNAAVSDSMYSRWMQYGALSTICRVHCTNYEYIHQEGRMPWLFGETAEDVTKAYVGMRYRLLPLFYSLSYENYTDGLPVMRRLDIEYPEYVEAQRNDEYMLGSYIVVAPIDEAVTNQKVDNSALTHLENGKETAGLAAEYYANKDWSGTPVRRQSDANIFFDWGTGGPAGLGADNFSVKWSGNITIGKNPAALSFFADDAVIVWLDGEKVIDGSDVYDCYLSTKVLAANSKHTLEVYYAEYQYNAHIYMYYMEQPAAGGSICNNSRTVFLPEGTWIDVWSGKRFVGPATYTVTHPLETSPIFVREGALITLAQNMTNTGEKDWSEMALDVYPSRNFTASTTLYEDDTTTVAYKSGHYRTTDIAMCYDKTKNALCVTIDAAKGTFSGIRAFGERSWNVRVHTNPEWGDLLRAKVNGKNVSLSFFGQSSEAMPFAFSGAARDGDLYEFTVEGSVYEKYEIELYFDGAADSAVNQDYDDTQLNFSVSAEKAGDGIDLTEAGSIDWISYGDELATEAVRKNGGAGVFSFPSGYDSPWLVYDNFFLKEYSDGDVLEWRSGNGGIASQKDFSLEIKTAGKEAYYVLYVGGNQCTAKLTVRDRAGNVRTLVFGDLNGRFLRRIVIECPDDTKSTLYVTYAMQASETDGTGSPSNVTLLGGFASSLLPDISDKPDTNLSAQVVSSVTAAGKADLSDAGADLKEETLDWMQFGDDGGVKSVRRIGGTAIENVTFREGRGFSDYPMTLSYTDGDELCAHTGTKKGTCTPGGITLTFAVTPEVKHIRLYTGAWQATNTVEVYTRKGRLLSAADSFTVGSIAEGKVVTIAVDAKEADTLIVLIKSSKEGGGGNVSLAGVAVTGTPKGSTATVSMECTELSEAVNLTARGSADWLYFGTGAKRKNGAKLPDLSNIQFGAPVNFNDYGVSLSYADGNDGSAASLTGGKAFDYARFTVAIDTNTRYIELYASVFDATAGIVVLDENGNALLRAEPHRDTDSSMDSFLIKLSVEAQRAQTLTVVYYKGGSGSGNAGLAAVAVS